MTTSKKFQKKKEDFDCEACGAENQGSGYTNHCRLCLVSKHVDIHPGDRLATCGGIMPVIDITHKGGKIVLTQRCRICGHLRNDHFRDGVDSVDALIMITKNLNNKYNM